MKIKLLKTFKHIRGYVLTAGQIIPCKKDTPDYFSCVLSGTTIRIPKEFAERLFDTDGLQVKFPQMEKSQGGVAMTDEQKNKLRKAMATVVRPKTEYPSVRK